MEERRFFVYKTRTIEPHIVIVRRFYEVLAAYFDADFRNERAGDEIYFVGEDDSEN